MGHALACTGAPPAGVAALARVHPSAHHGVCALQVYAFFLGVFNASKAVGVLGYILVVVEMFTGPMLRMLLPPGTSLLLLWCARAYALLSRGLC